MKFLKKSLIVIASLVALFLIVSLFIKTQYTVEREIIIKSGYYK